MQNFFRKTVKRCTNSFEAPDQFDADEERVDQQPETGVGQKEEQKVEPFQQGDRRPLERLLLRPEQKEQDEEVVGHDVAREPVAECMPVESSAAFKTKVCNETRHRAQEDKGSKGNLQPERHFKNALHRDISCGKQQDQQEGKRPFVCRHRDRNHKGRHPNILQHNRNPVHEFRAVAVHLLQVGIEVHEYFDRSNDECAVAHRNEQLRHIGHLREHGRLKDGRCHEDHIGKEEQFLPRLHAAHLLRFYVFDCFNQSLFLASSRSFSICWKSSEILSAVAVSVSSGAVSGDSFEVLSDERSSFSPVKLS